MTGNLYSSGAVFLQKDTAFGTPGSIVPVVVLFLLLQWKIFSDLTAGVVKGQERYYSAGSRAISAWNRPVRHW